MLVYLASPYTHKSAHIMKYREEQVTITAAKLTEMFRVTLFLPITQSAAMARACPGLFGHTFSAWKDIDLDAIDHSDEVWVVKLSGWKKSVGVQAEIEYALKLKKPVKYINPKTLRFVNK